MATARRIARKLGDAALLDRNAVAAQALAVYSAMRPLVQTEEGNAFLRVYEELAAIVRPRQGNKRKDATTAPEKPAQPAVQAPVTDASPRGA